MLGKFTKDQIGLLLLIHRLQNRDQLNGSDTIIPLAQIKLPRVAEMYQELFLDLLNEGLFNGNPEHFSLTDLGKELVHQAGTQYSLVGWFYDEYYRAVESSKTHSQFCERVYGKDLKQHGVADLEQLEIMLDELELEKGMNWLDFGCGSGRITEYLADLTGTRASGIDKSQAAIEIARERTKTSADRLKFYWTNIHKKRGALPSEQFDRVIAIDSLFFAPDQKLVFRVLYDLLKPEGRMIVFYICPPGTLPQETTLGHILADLDITFRVRDLSDLNKKHWNKKKKVLLELEEDF